MDPVSAFGVAAAVAQFISLGLRVTQRLAEYTSASPLDVPRSFQNIHAQLPLLLDSLSRVNTEDKVSQYGIDTRCMLRGVVVGCLKLVEEVETVASKLIPQPGESVKVKLKKVLSSLNSDERLVEIDRGLQTYIQVLILHQVINRNEVQVGPPEEQSYFEVKEKQVEPYQHRQALISQLDKCFYACVRCQRDRPEFVVLQGEKGVGKSQLALGFCYEARDANQFRTVFWLDASSPESLQMSLEGAAIAVRHKKDGTRKEKLDFVNRFLTERWQPWLLVLDNYNGSAFSGVDVASFLPQEGYGAVLVVSTPTETQIKGQVVRVPPFLDAKDELYLRRNVTSAVERGQLAVVQSAIMQGLNVNQYDTNDWPFLSRAALLGFEPIVALLLENGADPLFDRTKRSALAWAAGNGHASVVTMLLEQEDKVKAWLQKEDYVDAIFYAIENGHAKAVRAILDKRNVDLNIDQNKLSRSFVRCSREGGLELLKWLCSIGAFPASDSEKADALRSAVKGFHVDIVKFLVSEAGFQPDLLEDRGGTALCSAAALQDSWKPDVEKVRNDLVSFLLAAGASTSIKSSDDGTSPLHEAALRSFVSTVEILLAAGADPTVEDKYGYTALQMASKHKSPASFPALISVEIADAAKREKYFTTALYFASRVGDRELLVAIVDKVDINAVEARSGDSALLLAIKNGNTQVARYLIRHGASHSFKSSEGDMPILLATEKGMDLVVRDLFKAGGSSILETTDGNGNTPLLLAAKKNHEKVIRELLKAGADKEAENKYGETALDIAEEKELKKVVKLLEGLDITTSD